MASCPPEWAERIRAASPDATLAGCLQAALAAAGAAMTPQQRAKAAQRVLVVAANTEVQERGLQAGAAELQRLLDLLAHRKEREAPRA